MERPSGRSKGWCLAPALVSGWNGGERRDAGATVKGTIAGGTKRRHGDAARGKLPRCHCVLAEGIGADSCFLKLGLVSSIFTFHGFLLSLEGSGFAAALAALAEAGDGAEAGKEGAYATCRSVNGDFGRAWQGVEFLADSGLWWLLDVEERLVLG